MGITIEVAEGKDVLTTDGARALSRPRLPIPQRPLTGADCRAGLGVCTSPNKAEPTCRQASPGGSGQKRRTNMTRTIRARVTRGVLAPVEPLDLPDGSEVEVTVSTGPSTAIDVFEPR